MAKHITGRSAKQCRERWDLSVNPKLKKKNWTEEEDKIIVELHNKFGNKWAFIASQIPGRSDNAIKNRFNGTIKRKFEK